MLKILVDYPLHDEELTVVHRSLASAPELPQVLSIEELRALQKTVDHVYVDPALVTSRSSSRPRPGTRPRSGSTSWRRTCRSARARAARSA